MANDQISAEARSLLAGANFIESPDGRCWMRPRNDTKSNVTLLTVDIIAGGVEYVRRVIAEDASRDG